MTGPFADAATEWARMITNAVATSIPNSTGAGTYNTVLLMNEVVEDTLGSGVIADLANSRMLIPAGKGFTHCQIGYSIAFSGPAILAGWCGARVKNSSGSNYGNSRIPFVATDATTNPQVWTPLIKITDPGSLVDAPRSIPAGDWISLYPAQTSAAAVNAGADLASSWLMMLLFRR